MIKTGSKKEDIKLFRWALEIYLCKSRQKRKTDGPSSNHAMEVQSHDSEDSQSD